MGGGGVWDIHFKIYGAFSPGGKNSNIPGPLFEREEGKGVGRGNGGREEEGGREEDGR